MFTGWEKGHLACKIQCHLFTTVFFQSNQKNKTLQNCLKFLFQQPTFWNYSKFSQEFQKDFLNNCVTFYSQIPILLPSVLWRCWLGGRKGIRPVKNLSGGVLAWLSVWSVMQTFIWPSWCHCHSLSLASVKPKLVSPFWYWLTQVIPEKGPLNGCVCCLLYTSPSPRD